MEEEREEGREGKEREIELKNFERERELLPS